MTDVMLACGESSGDKLGGELAAELLSKQPSLRIAGVGMEMMRKPGVEIIASGDVLSVMGYVDVLPRLPSILSLRHTLLKEIRRRRPRLFIGIDAPDFNLRIAAEARAMGVKTVQYVSPSVWMWRRERIHKIARAVDAVWCLLPFEPSYYEAEKVAAVFVGHPLAKTQPPDKTLARAQLNLSTDEKIIALMPGSRLTELQRHLPLFAEITRRMSDIRFIAIAANATCRLSIQQALPNVQIFDGDAMNIIPAADAALIKCGTSALQCALAKTPMVIVYKISRLAAFIGARYPFLHPFFALPNILSGRFVAPELIQDEAQADEVAGCLRRTLEDEQHRAQQIAAYDQIRHQLTAASTTAADCALDMLCDN